MENDLIEGEQALSRTLMEHYSELEIEFVAVAKALCEECHGLIRAHDGQRKHRKPPVSLTHKRASGRFGPNIVWVSYTSDKRVGQRGNLVRFTSEVPGRRNLRYPRSIFRDYDPALREMLWEVECRAVPLRERISHWRTVFNDASRTIARGAK